MKKIRVQRIIVKNVCIFLIFCELSEFEYTISKSIYKNFIGCYINALKVKVKNRINKKFPVITVNA